MDYFVICCPEPGEVYVITAREVGAKPTVNNQQMFVRWAEDYTFEKHVVALKSSGERVSAREGGEWVV